MKIVNDSHHSEYGVMPDLVVKAPGRFHLIGDHSWFFKDKTLSMAVNIPVYVAFSKREDTSFRFYFKQLNERKKANLTSLKYKKEDRWSNAVKAIIYGYTSGGFSVSGLDITIYSDILPSAGFGITTAIKIAVAVGIRELFGLSCSDVQILQVIERANRRFLQINNYIADNYTALFAKKGNLIITDHAKNLWDYVPFSFEGKKIFLIDTKVPRFTVWNEEVLFDSQNALYIGDLKDQKNGVYGGWQYINNITDINEGLSLVNEETRRRLICIMREHNDVLEARDGLERKDFFKFARAVNHSHESMRDMYEISCPEIDWIIKRVGELEPNLEMLSKPVSCGRITGKGFARCLYAVIRSSDEENFKAKLAEFEKIFGYHPECYEVVPSEGASIVKD